MERISNIAERLKQYRTEKNLSCIEMEKLTGVPAQTINRYELGQRVPKIDTAVNIAESLNVNPLWLQGYDVPQSLSSNEKKLENEVVSYFGALPESKKAEALRYLRFLAESE